MGNMRVLILCVFELGPFGTLGAGDAARGERFFHPCALCLSTEAGEHLIEEPLIAIEREFTGRFVRVHRNCLVARAAIRGFERSSGAAGGDEEQHWNVVLEGLDERLPVSRRQWPTLKSLLPEAKE